MATFRSDNIHKLCRLYVRQVVNREKHYTFLGKSLSAKDLLSRHKYFVPSILPVNGFEHLRNYVYDQVFYSSKSKEKPLNLDSLVNYERVAEETLQSIYDRFEEILQNSGFVDYDVNYSNGVLTISLEEKCVYVMNKQTPNRQIWLSSPVSGPKRYDYVNGVWIYKHDGVSLHQLLSNELSQLLQKDIDFFICTYSN